MKLDFSLNPSELLHLASLYSTLPGTTLLYSGGVEDSAKRSFLCLNPVETITIDATSWTKENFVDMTIQKGSHTDPWTSVQSLLKFSSNQTFKNAPMWVGYFAYEMGAFCDLSSPLPYHTPDIPLAKFFKCGTVIELDHSNNKASLLLADEYFYLQEKTTLPNKLFESSSTQLIKPPCLESEYSALVDEIRRQISLGNVYQVNLSHECKWDFCLDPYPLFTSLANENPSPFSAYMQAGHFTLLSSSPERLLQKQGSTLEARPIKGTAPRGKTEQEDALFAKNLLNSVKDQAELLMITDLLRNDLGKISLPGTVQVDPLIKIEKYTNVFHLLSVVKSTVKDDMSSIDILRNIFPGGSITGCPKMAAMEMIYRMESRPRGIYTGSIGYFTSTGDFDFNIAIRTLEHKDNVLSLSIGGAIVSDSDPLLEYQETLHKGASIFKALKTYQTRVTQPLQPAP